MQPLIWLVEDEAGIADTLVYALQTEGYTVRWFERGLPVLDALVSERPALVILDVGLPDINGFDLYRQLLPRADLPLMFLTARSEEIDRIVGLELGADDYVAKPFSPREVCARVRSILRRSERTRPAETEKSVFSVDETGASIHYHGKLLSLTRYEYLLLKTLLTQPGRVYTRAQLMDLVWQDAEDSLERTVDTHIKTLRAKLREVDARSDPIMTHRGLGYSLKGQA